MIRLYKNGMLRNKSYAQYVYMICCIHNENKDINDVCEEKDYTPNGTDGAQ